MFNCLYFDVKNNKIDLIKISDSLELIKKKLDIDSPITIVTRKIGSRYYDIICDDEGLFKTEDDGKVVVGAICLNCEEFLAGNLLITKNDSYDKFDKEDYDNLKQSIFQTKEQVDFDYNTSIGLVNVKFKKDSYFISYKV